MIRTCFKRNAFLIAFVVILQLEYNVGVKYPESLEGLALKSDMSVFWNSIERLLKLCESDKNNLDINMYLGLFLLHVNLRHAMAPGFPKALASTLMQLLESSESLLLHFLSKTDVAKHPEEIILLLLFTSVDNWLKELGRYDSDNHEVVFKSKDQLIAKYSFWGVYVKRLDSASNTPNKAQLDRCLGSLAGNPIVPSGNNTKCAILEECYGAILNGTEYGTSLCYRFLILVSARFGRGCYIFSRTEDEEMSNKFCADMFDEAQFIATNGYKRPELLAQQVALCTLVGHVEFVRRAWLNEALKRQRAFGCFDPAWPQQIENQKCSMYYTAVAAGALGAAARFVLATYY